MCLGIELVEAFYVAKGGDGESFAVKAACEVGRELFENTLSLAFFYVHVNDVASELPVETELL